MDIDEMVYELHQIANGKKPDKKFLKNFKDIDKTNNLWVVTAIDTGKPEVVEIEVAFNENDAKEIMLDMCRRYVSNWDEHDRHYIEKISNLKWYKNGCGVLFMFNRYPSPITKKEEKKGIKDESN